MVMSTQILGSINVFIINENKVLLTRRKNTGWMDGYLCPPGGHIEPGESPTDAALRELKEELGVDVQKSDLEFLCVAARNTSPNQYVAYEFAVRNKDLTITNSEPDKCDEIMWVDMNDLPSDLIPDFGKIIALSILGNTKYLELGFE